MQHESRSKAWKLSGRSLLKIHRGRLKKLQKADAEVGTFESMSKGNDSKGQTCSGSLELFEMDTLPPLSFFIPL